MFTQAGNGSESAINAGAGVPGAAVRDSATGRVIDRVTGQTDVYSAVTGTGNNRLFYLAARSSRAETAQREPDIGQIPPGGAFSVRIDDAGTVVDLSAVPGIPEPDPASPGPTDLATTADGSTLAYPVVPPSGNGASSGTIPSGRCTLRTGPPASSPKRETTRTATS